MKREEIEQTTKGVLTDFRGSKNLLVSFGGIKQCLGMPVFEFFNSISDIDCDKVFIRDFKQAWYQKGVDEQLDTSGKIVEYLKKILSENNYNNVCFLGNSMGGYAAILFGSILNVDKVIAFSPQSYIDCWNRLKNLEKRWTKQMLRIYLYKGKNKAYFDLQKHLSANSNYKTDINIFYSTQDRLDKIHSERLKMNKHVMLHPISKGGHDVVLEIRNSGELKPLLLSIFKMV